MSYAQKVDIPNLPFLDFNSDIVELDNIEGLYGDFSSHHKENDNLKELKDMFPSLNTKDSDDDIDYSDSNSGYKSGKKDVFGSEIKKDNGTSPSITSPSSFLSPFLDNLPYSEVLSGSSLLSSPSPSPSKGPSFSESEMGDIIPGQYIVVLNDDTLNLREIFSAVAEKVNLEGTQILHVYENVLNGFAISVPDKKVIEALEQSPFVDYIEKDKVVKTFAQTLPNGINRVDGDLSSTASGNGYGTVNADIAILDTGVQINHPDLYIYHEKTFVSGTSSANDDNGHGTHVAGIAAAKDNSIGGVGIAPGAKLWAIKVLDKYGVGALSTVIKGIDWIRYSSQVEVANLSLGCECESLAFDTAIKNAVNSGITLVVAAGNLGKDASTFSPANNPNVIAVSAIGDSDGKCGAKGPVTGYGNDDTLASFSNYGAVVDMAAPGTKIYSTYTGSSYATMSGTSMASPHVAGAAALYYSTHAGASPEDVRKALLNEGSTPSTTCDGNGRGYFTNDKDNYREPLLYARNY